MVFILRGLIGRFFVGDRAPTSGVYVVPQGIEGGGGADALQRQQRVKASVAILVD